MNSNQSSLSNCSNHNDYSTARDVIELMEHDHVESDNESMLSISHVGSCTSSRAIKRSKKVKRCGNILDVQEKDMDNPSIKSGSRVNTTSDTIDSDSSESDSESSNSSNSEHSVVENKHYSYAILKATLPQLDMDMYKHIYTKHNVLNGYSLFTDVYYYEYIKDRISDQEAYYFPRYISYSLECANKYGYIHIPRYYMVAIPVNNDITRTSYLMRMIISLLKNLQILQNLGIVHNDIKPENIMLKYKSSPDSAFLIDYGNAIMASDLEKCLSTDITANRSFPPWELDNYKVKSLIDKKSKYGKVMMQLGTTYTCSIAMSLRKNSLFSSDLESLGHSLAYCIGDMPWNATIIPKPENIKELYECLHGFCKLYPPNVQNQNDTMYCSYLRKLIAHNTQFVNSLILRDCYFCQEKHGLYGNSVETDDTDLLPYLNDAKIIKLADDDCNMDVFTMNDGERSTKYQLLTDLDINLLNIKHTNGGVYPKFDEQLLPILTNMPSKDTGIVQTCVDLIRNSFSRTESSTSTEPTCDYCGDGPRVCTSCMTRPELRREDKGVKDISKFINTTEKQMITPDIVPSTHYSGSTGCSSCREDFTYVYAHIDKECMFIKNYEYARDKETIHGNDIVIHQSASVADDKNRMYYECVNDKDITIANCKAEYMVETIRKYNSVDPTNPYEFIKQLQSLIYSNCREGLANGVYLIPYKSLIKDAEDLFESFCARYNLIDDYTSFVTNKNVIRTLRDW